MTPQVSQTLVETANTSDRIITLPNDDVDDDHHHLYTEQHQFDPPESFWLSKDAEFDWFDRNAFFDRKDSTKANGAVSNSNPSSQRFSVAKKSKTSIIGLPKPPQQKPCLVDARNRRNQTNNRLFPKRGPEPGSEKADASMTEPSSPKVSCMGRVRSRRDRNRRLKNRQRSLKKSPSTSEKTFTTEQRRKKKSLWKNLRSIFQSGSGSKPVPEPDSQKPQTKAKTKTASRSHVLSREGSAAVNVSPPGLGNLARFSSGRRSDAWVGDVVEINSGPLDGRCSLQKRRETGPLKEVNCSRDWGSAGPASV